MIFLKTLDPPLNPLHEWWCEGHKAGGTVNVKIADTDRETQKPFGLCHKGWTLVPRYNEIVYKIAFSLYSSLLSIRYFEMGRSKIQTHLGIPDREKGGIERKGNFINCFIVPWVWDLWAGKGSNFSKRSTTNPPPPFRHRESFYQLTRHFKICTFVEI